MQRRALVMERKGWRGRGRERCLDGIYQTLPTRRINSFLAEKLAMSELLSITFDDLLIFRLPWCRPHAIVNSKTTLTVYFETSRFEVSITYTRRCSLRVDGMYRQLWTRAVDAARLHFKLPSRPQSKSSVDGLDRNIDTE